MRNAQIPYLNAIQKRYRYNQQIFIYGFVHLARVFTKVGRWPSDLNLNYLLVKFVLKFPAIVDIVIDILRDVRAERNPEHKFPIAVEKHQILRLKVSPIKPTV